MILKLGLAFGFIGAAGASGYKPVMDYWEERNRVQWETVEVTSGDITRFVNSTGTIQPVLSVAIGCFVSGPIVELNVDFNDEVKKGDILARIDPQLFQANLDRDEATLATRMAELERVDAQMEQAQSNLARGKSLQSRGNGFISGNELDSLNFEVKSLIAQRKLAEATILQAKATLQTSRANLNYCDITSPVDGIVVNRLINPGQTVAAQFQTPELFVVAPDLREKVHVFASVDEADIGLIQRAKSEKRPVTFTVDAHPDETFVGEIEQIRVSSVATQNVVTYPVVIATRNDQMELLPGMTASISFEVDSRKSVARIPNAALRFYPDDVNQVRESDRHLIDGSVWNLRLKPKSEAQADEDAPQNASEKAAAQKKKNERHVWMVDGKFLKAVSVTTGLTENRFTEVVDHGLDVGASLVTGKKD